MAFKPDRIFLRSLLNMPVWLGCSRKRFLLLLFGSTGAGLQFYTRSKGIKETEGSSGGNMAVVQHKPSCIQSLLPSRTVPSPVLHLSNQLDCHLLLEKITGLVPHSRDQLLLQTCRQGWKEAGNSAKQVSMIQYEVQCSFVRCKLLSTKGKNHK